jgi:proteasome accessory factor B
VGHTDYRDSVRTFKLDRIQQAEMLEETFEVPEDVYPSQMLANSWGIVFGDALKEVVLRFDPSVARRIDETLWHASQKVEHLDDGGRILRMRVSGTLEIEPWIKTWGSSCEVLKPASLRAKMEEEARALARLYGVSAPEPTS